MSAITIDKDSIAYQGGLLGIVAALAAGLLLVIGAFTADAIAMRQYEDQMAGLNQVLPPELYVNDLLKSERQFDIEGVAYRVFTAVDEANNITGYAVQSAAQGYAGDIKLVVGLDAKQAVLAVRVLAHTETPGLGDKIEITKSRWIESFQQASLQSLTPEQWAVKKDGGQFDQFTGATITPRAVVSQVHQSLVVMQQTIIPKLQNEVVIYE